ncbi:hypothetical protein BN12_2870002 [Nostocoides japonicum T1-X7]|uniref:Nuclease SbcCD subunit C n=1 Tax=Nostocoides japonicum T1-X7 TaxID=1194083 RepID=A0A077M2F7_9MICO|nr:hypothetical protein BN12_2870002 [Tetrasphaera japonica T1-X7]
MAAAQDKAARALVVEAQLADDADEVARSRATLDAALRAAPVRAHLELLASAETEVVRRRDALDAAVQGVPSGVVQGIPSRAAQGIPLGAAQEEPDAGRWSALLARVTAGDATIEEAVRLGDEVVTGRADIVRSRAESARLSRRAEELADDVIAHTEGIDGLTTTHEELLTAAGSLPAAESALAEARRRRDLRRAVDRGALDLEESVDRLREWTDAEQSAREAYLELREARLDGMAAELAASLSDGAACPVCGAQDHPAPASHTRAPVAAEDVEEAERVHQSLLAARADAAARVARLRGAQETRLAQLAGDERDEEALDDEVRQADAAVARAKEARTAAADVAQELEQARRDLEALMGERLLSVEAAGAAEAAATAHERRAGDAATRLQARLVRHRDECPCACVDAPARTATTEDGDPKEPWDPERLRLVAERHRAVRQALGDVVRRVDQVEESTTRLEAQRATTEAALAGADFSDAQEVRSALLSPAALQSLRDRLRRHEEALVRVRAVLDDPDVVAALASDPVDVDATAARRDATVEAARRAVHRLADAQGTFRTGAALIAEIDAHVTALEPLLTRQVVVAEVADAATGSGSNTLRMPLSSYVLAARLERVAALANERLAVMGEGRFELRHTDDRRGNGRSGLGLEVVDLWTGQPRATSTLSGGESFMASLALALGLADAVREEAGGIDLQTLFVDEGFGTLDDESLEQVMAVLDTLRDGGRAVGVVSHVADLRHRIPHQLRVLKTPHGSSVDVVDLAAG